MTPYASIFNDAMYHQYRDLKKIHEYHSENIPLEKMVTGNDLYMAIRGRVILTSKARDYQSEIEPWIDRLPSNVIVATECCVAIFEYALPAAKLELEPGVIRTATYDLTNITKPTEDAIFRKLGIDDSLTTTKIENKVVSPNSTFYLRVSVHLFGDSECL